MSFYSLVCWTVLLASGIYTGFCVGYCLGYDKGAGKELAFPTSLRMTLKKRKRPLKSKH